MIVSSFVKIGIISSKCNSHPLHHDLRFPCNLSSRITFSYDFEIEGSACGQFVPSISGRNIVYGPKVDVSQMTREERQSWQAAMGQHCRRQKLAK